MSLVSEALRKARAEAAAREGKGRGVPRALALPPKRWRSGPGLVLAILTLLAAALGGAAIAWWALRHPPSHGSARLEAHGAVPATGVHAAATQPAPGAPAPVFPSAQPPGEAVARPAAPAGKLERPSMPAPTPDMAGQGEAPPPAPAAVLAAAPNVSEPARGRPVASAGLGESARERSFVIDADLGYTKLHLDFIVYRPGAPFAEINGGQVMVGSVIDGFTVEEIAEEFVKLRDRHGVVILRIH